MKREQIPQRTHWGRNPQMQWQQCAPRYKGSSMEHSADGDAEFWRDALLAGGFTAIPRWTLDPVTGSEAHEATIPDELVARLHRLSDQLGLPLSSVLLAAHAKV